MDMRENLQQGLKNYTNRCKNLNKLTSDKLLDLYGEISIFINKSIDQYSQIAYYAQELQNDIKEEIQMRIE